MTAHTDSQMVLAWLHNAGERQPVFIRNRIRAVQTWIPEVRWEFIKGDDNPANIPSRGSTPKDLLNNRKWWYGPQRTKVTCMLARIRQKSTQGDHTDITDVPDPSRPNNANMPGPSRQNDETKPGPSRPNDATKLGPSRPNNATNRAPVAQTMQLCRAPVAQAATRRCPHRG